MVELDGYRSRVEAAREAWASMPRLGPGRLGPPDPDTGERWDRGHVMAHVAEMLPFWTEQIRAVVAGAPAIGRGDEGNARRREGIDGGHDQGEDELLRRIDGGLTGLSTFLGQLNETDLDRRARFLSEDGDREVEVRYALDRVLIGHVEGHLRQLQDLQALA
jgi:hypothetical protein